MRIRCGVVAMAVWFTLPIFAAPALTTIEDTLYKADGSRFNGVAFVEWKSFQAADFSNIATHSVTVSIINGALRVQLVPTTNASPGAYYSVRYHSDGRIQFDEIWAVPPSSAKLKLRDVRVPSATSGTQVVPPAAETQVQESDVIGLIDDLEARPLKGPGFAPSRTAYISETGALEAVSGSLSDCVRVDGTAGPCSLSGPGFVDGEVPAGLIDGSNAGFTLGNIPTPLSSLSLYRNGVLQKAGLDYILADQLISFTMDTVPQAGDVLTASYRLADPGNPVGAAGGALTGTYPRPWIASGVITDLNIASTAGILESKLALNFATHSTANDPTSGQKAALAGTAGTPSTSNRYLTNEDPRLATPPTHNLLGSSHGDTTTGTPVRGDIVVAKGTSPASWSRLAIGLANRCLMSDGADVVWTTCLHTAFSEGSVPFVNASGDLAQNNPRFHWDDSNRRLSLGNNLAQATLYLYDAQPSTGLTGLVVRGGQGQGSNPLQTWLDPSGTELAKVDAAGNLSGPSFRAATSADRAAWRDSGAASDPSSKADGDLWYNTSDQVRRSQESGQVHALPQVICSSTGSSTSAIALTRLGSCTIPANFLKPGDRVETHFSYSHEGTARAFTFEIHWGGSTVVSRTGATSETRVVGGAQFGVHSGGALWDVESWGSTLALASAAGNAADSLTAPLVIDLLASFSSSTTDTVTLRNFTVVRYPAQANP